MTGLKPVIIQARALNSEKKNYSDTVLIDTWALVWLSVIPIRTCCIWLLGPLPGAQMLRVTK